MPRDKEIRRSFEIADDGMQGTIGYYYYVVACEDSATIKGISKRIPKNQIPVTFEWGRFYNPQDLIGIMGSCFGLYHARICLVSSISVFESALKGFIERLNNLGLISNTKKRKLQHYKKKLEWVFDIVSGSTYGTKTMQERIPDLWLNVDHARRIRNLWMHNNGLLNEKYESDCISIIGKQPIVVGAYQEYKRSKNKIPIALKPDSFIPTCLSHIELLHQIHHNIQKEFFGQKRAYSYKSLRKGIEWQRLLIGI